MFDEQIDNAYAAFSGLTYRQAAEKRGATNQQAVPFEVPIRYKPWPRHERDDPQVAQITPTKFEDLRTGDVSFGYTIFDGFSTDYIKWHDGGVPDNDLDCLRQLVEMGFHPSEPAWAIFRDVVLYKIGIEIGGTFYPWEDIRDIFEK